MVGKYTNSCKSCVFVEKWVDITTYRDYSKNIDIKIYLKDVSSTDVEKYIDERKAEYKGFATFKDYLDDVFARGEKYYADSLAKSEKRDAKEIEDKKKIKEILKNLK